MRFLIVLCFILLLSVGVAAAQVSDGECVTGDAHNRQPERTALQSHRVKFGMAEDGVVDRRTAALIIDEASVPEGVVGPDGQLWVYYINGAPNSPHGIHISVQMDDGTWELLDCVKFDGEFNGNGVDPDIVRLADGRYRLFYFLGNFVRTGPPDPSAPPPTRSPDEMHSIYSAVSKDGINFTVEGVAFEFPLITDPTVVQLPDGMWMMAAAYNGRIAVARSDDGLTFTSLEPVEDDGIPELSLDAEGNVLLWGREQWRTSDGGMTWARTGSMSLGPDPSIVQLDDGRIAFFYKDFNPDMMPPRGQPPEGNLPPCPPITEDVTPIPCATAQPQSKNG